MKESIKPIIAGGLAGAMLFFLSSGVTWAWKEVQARSAGTVSGKHYAVEPGRGVTYYVSVRTWHGTENWIVDGDTYEQATIGNEIYR